MREPTHIAAAEQLRAILDGVNGAFVCIDRFGIVTAWTSDAERIFGFVQDEVVNNDLIEIIVRKDVRAEKKIAFSRYLQSGAQHDLGQRLELPVVCKNGIELIVGVTISELDDRSGFVVFLNDITERREAQRQLIEANTLLQSMLDNTNALIFAKDLDGRYLFANSKYAELYGLTSTDLIGKNEFDLVPIEDALEMGELDRITLAHDGPLTIRRAGGLNGRPTRIFVSTRFVLRHADGTPRGICGVAIDDTQRELANEALRQSEERYQRTVANIPGMVYRYVQTSDAESKLEFVSEGSREILGLEPDALMTNVGLLLEAIHEDDRSSFVAMTSETFETLKPWRWEGRIRHSNGNLLWVQAVAHPSRLPNGDTVWDGLIIDRTQEKETEMALAVRNEELESANQFKLDLIGMLSHDIGSPLTAIIGFTEMVLDGNDLSAAAKQYLDVVMRSANAVENIRREVLTMCSIDAGELTAEREIVDVAGAVQHMTELTEVDIHPGIEIQKDLQAWVHPVHFTQIVGNYLSNAKKYGNGVSRLTAIAQGDSVEVRVYDEGPGIPEDFREHLFERFSRAKDGDPNVQGIGLGLFIVKSLAEANQGSVWYEMNEPSGSVFVLRLERAMEV